MMKTLPKIWLGTILLVIIITGVFWFAPEKNSIRATLIATEVPEHIDLLHGDLGVDDRYIAGARIVYINTEDEGSEPSVLTAGFFSARAPEVSYDGQKLLFSGQKEEGDVWQIYSMDLETRKINEITSCPVNCTDPVWLPDGRVLFSRLNDDPAAGRIHVLYACDPDGSNIERLTHDPNTAVSSSVFMDGRILTLSRQRYPEIGKLKMLALRTDGTKSELFFENDSNTEMAGRAWEAKDGSVFFIERKDNNKRNSTLASVSVGHPMSSYRNWSENITGEFHSLYPDEQGRLLVSFRTGPDTPFVLAFMDTEKASIGNVRYSAGGYHLIEPVMAEARDLPMKLPLFLDSSKDRGTLLCINSNRSMDPVRTVAEGKQETDKVQVWGLEGMLGELPVEEDGSFYIEIDADTPVRFVTLNADGEILRGPSSWIYVRPNEKRSCIGCHEDRELAPPNVVPEALYTGMYSLPEGNKSEEIVLNKKRKRRNEE